MTSNISAFALPPPPPPPLLSANYSMLPLFLWLQGGSTSAIDYYAPSAPLSVAFGGYEPVGAILSATQPQHHQHPHHFLKHHHHSDGGRTAVAGSGGLTASGGGGGESPRGAEWNSPYHPVLQVIGWIVSSLLSLETIVGNAMVIVAYRIERSISKQVSNRFIVSLAVSDLIIGIEGIPLFTVYVINGDRWPLGKMACETWLFLDYTLCLVSILTVLLITVDRYLSVCHTAKYLKWQNPVKIQLLVLFSWLMPALIFGVMIYGWPFLNAADEEDVSSARARGAERLPASSPDIRRITVNASRRDADGRVRTDVFSASASTASRMKMLSKIQTNANGECFAPFLSNPYVNMSMYVAYYWTTLIAMLILYKGIHKAAKKLEKKAKAKEHRHIALLLTQRLGTQVGVSLMLQSKKREEELLMTSSVAGAGTAQSNAPGASATRPPAKAEMTRDSGYNTNTLSTTCGSGGGVLTATTSDMLGIIPPGTMAPKTSTVLPPITLHCHSRPRGDDEDDGGGGCRRRSSTADNDDDEEGIFHIGAVPVANYHVADDYTMNEAPVRKRSATYGGLSTQLEEEAAAASVVDGQTVGIYRRQVGGTAGGGRWLTRLRIGRLRSWSQSACEAFVQQLPPVQRRRFTFLNGDEESGPCVAPTTRNAPPDQLDDCALSAASSMVQLDASSESSSEFDVLSRGHLSLKFSVDEMADCDAFATKSTQQGVRKKRKTVATTNATISSAMKAYPSMGGGGIFAARNLLLLGPPNTPDYQESYGNDGEELLTPPSLSVTSPSSAAASSLPSASSVSSHSSSTTSSSSSSTSSSSVTAFSPVLTTADAPITKNKCRHMEAKRRASTQKVLHSASHHDGVPDATEKTQRVSRSITASPFLASAVCRVERFQWSASSTTTVVEREAVSPFTATNNMTVATRQQSNATTASCSAAEHQRSAPEETDAMVQRCENVNLTPVTLDPHQTVGCEGNEADLAPTAAGRGGWWINTVGRRISGMLLTTSPRRATTSRLSGDETVLGPKRSPPSNAQPERRCRRRSTIRSTSCSSTSSTSSSVVPAERRAAPPGSAIAALVMRHRPPTAIVQSAPAPPDQRYAAQLLPKRHSSATLTPQLVVSSTTRHRHRFLGDADSEKSLTPAASRSSSCVVSTLGATSSAFLSVGAPPNEFGRKLSTLTRSTGDRLVQSVFAPITAFNRIRKRTRAEKRAHKAFRTITFIVGLFAILWSPYYVVATIYGFCRGECISSVVYNLSYYMCYLNSSGNPFAYALANRQFRSAFLRMFRGDFNRIA